MWEIELSVREMSSTEPVLTEVLARASVAPPVAEWLFNVAADHVAEVLEKILAREGWEWDAGT